MKNYFCVFIFSFILSACHTSPSYKITGIVHGERFENKLVYLTPLENATPENTDSTYIVNGKFCFEGPYISDEIRVIRFAPLINFFLQELLVIVEPGNISVIMDKTSMAAGTEQNNLLQEWKGKKEETDRKLSELKRKSRNTDKTSLIEVQNQICQEIEQLEEEYQSYNYNFIKQHWNTTVGQFVYKMVENSLSPEQQDSLKILEVQP